MENNEKTPRDNASGEHNNNGKKPYYKYNHRRRQSHRGDAQKPVEQTASENGISVRPGRYDLPPSGPQKTDIQINRPHRGDSEKNSSEHNNPRRNKRHRNDRRRDTQGAAPAVSENENTALPSEEPGASPAEDNAFVGGDRNHRRSRSGKRHTHDRKPRTDELLAEALEEFGIDDTYAEDDCAADNAPASEYITTAGSIDAEIIDEINSITESDAKRLEASDAEEDSGEEEAAREEEKLQEFAVVGIRFKPGGKVYYFDPGEFILKKGDSAIVETSRGIEFGVCELSNRTVTEREVVLPLRTVVRRATDADIAQHELNTAHEKEAYAVCAQKIIDHKLGMKLIDVEYAFDGSKLLFYFTAEGRVDFRELVKDLAAVFRTRIELRQIGIRDETKLLGGIGICGRPFCCKTFLSDFVQVSIKMAKEQNLSLNSVKISGACGRLMCCLRYEYDTYQEEIKKTPKVDQIVSTPDGEGTVIEVQPLAGLVRVRFGTKAEMLTPKVYHRDDVTVIGGKGVKPKDPPPAE